MAPEAIKAVVETLAHDAVRIKQELERGDYDAAHVRSRQLLSAASRLHSRLTGIVEALSELKEQQ